MSSFVIIIPARYASTRLEGKPLLEINDKPLIQHVYESASNSKAKAVYIATDDERIVTKAKEFNGNTILTSKHHNTGTDRLVEAIDHIETDNNEIIVNLQGDELGMSPVVINQVAEALHQNLQCNMSTICEEIEQAEQVLDPNTVKVVMDENNFALYFSRAPIPWDRDENGIPESLISKRQYFRHVGLYAYRKDFLLEYSQMQRCSLEITESLEQLRALYHGEKIHVSVAMESTGMGIDTPEDLKKARTEWASN